MYQTWKLDLFELVFEHCDVYYCSAENYLAQLDDLNRKFSAKGDACDLVPSPGDTQWQSQIY